MKALCFVLLTGAGIANVTAQQPSRAANPALDHAWQLVGEGRYDDAISVLRQLIARDPRDGKARLLIGSLLTERKDSGAIDQLNAAVRLMPKSAEAENALGEGFLALGDRRSAKPAFERAIKLEPRYGIAQLNLGRLLLEDGQAAAAGEHLGIAAKSLQQNDEAAEAYYLLGKIASERDDAAAAATELQHAVEANPKLAPAWSDLGAARQLLQNDRDALDAFERAVALNPSDSVARYRLGSELLRINKPHEAIEHLEAAYRLNPGDQSTLNALQAALRRDARSAEADEVRQKLSELLHSRDEKNQAALEAIKLNNQGAALEKAGDLKGAGERYKAALALYPEHNGIRVNYAVALLRQGQWTEGLKQLHEASKRDPANAQIQLALKDALSQAPPGTIPAWNDAK